MLERRCSHITCRGPGQESKKCPPGPAATANAADADAADDAVVFGLASTIVAAAAAAAFREIVFEAAATVVVVAGTDASAVVLMSRQQ